MLQLLIDNASGRRDPTLPHAANNRRDGVGIMLVGPSGAGKSTLLRNIFTDNSAFPNYGSITEWCPLLSVTAPAPCTLLQLAMRILVTLGYDSTRSLRENQAWLRVRLQLRELKILFLHIDDLQHVLHQLSEEEVQKVRDTLKDLMTDSAWPIHLILSGMPELVPFAKKDRQLRRRLRYLQLEPISPDRDREFLDITITDYVKKAGLKLTISGGDELVGRLCHAAQYQMGLTIEILIDAIENAIRNGNKVLKLSDFADAYGTRNLLPDDMNPFVAAAWDALDTSLLRPKDEEYAEEDIQEAANTIARPRRRRRRRH